MFAAGLRAEQNGEDRSDHEESEMAAAVINLTHKPRPAFDVYIGRAQFCGKEFFEPSPWANPFN
jgi:hypothetical protein